MWHIAAMPLKVSYEQRDGLMLVLPVGAASLEEFIGMLQQAGADSVRWHAAGVIVDLRGVTSEYSFTEQLRIGEAVGRNLAHIPKAAAVVQTHRITRVGEKAANHTGAHVRVFDDLAEAEQWVRS